MPIRVALSHKTSYCYDRLAFLSPHVIRLRPAPHCRTPVLSYALRVTPSEHFLNWQQDPYANYQARVVFPKPTREFVIEVDLVAELSSINPFDFFLEDSAKEFPFTYEPIVAKELMPYRDAAKAGPHLSLFVAQCPRRGRTIDAIVEVNRKVKERINYLIRLEPGIQSPEETLGKASGSCRDSAWLLVQALRHVGLAARFVSGYLIQLAPDVPSLEGPPGPSSDFCDLHAWAEVYLPGAGWVGLDPTSGLLASEGHLPLACSADPITAAAVTGSYSWTRQHEDDKVQEKFDFAMSVRRLPGTPRVTKPYSEGAWQAIERVGHEIDARLNAADVRLTMGGEPTFVGIDSPDDPQWNTAALGEGKRKLGAGLLRRLRKQFAPGGLLHFGQGKWYPGETLPRWAFSCYWRRDGEPIWRNDQLIGDEDRSDGMGEADAGAFIAALAQRLGVDPGRAIAGYEDAWYYLWRERRLPVNVDPLESRLDNAQERERLARVFERGLEKVVGFALPLRRGQADEPWRWVSGPWFFRAAHMYLVPGDSPMGFRLPLDMLPWVAPGDREELVEADPMAQRGVLPPRRALAHEVARAGPLNWRVPAGFVAQELEEAEGETGSTTVGIMRRLSHAARMRVSPGWGDGGDAPQPGESAPWVVRTALCVEPRGGRLYVFMPPVRWLEDYLELIAVVEETALALNMPVLIEGYQPPQDHRVNLLRVTPDPGVIEVNVHPSHSWSELVHNTTTLYEEARLSRLGAEKFMMDGRHTGTGGGNHVIIGGPTPQDSPILRRPDLLRSLVAYWHNHPALSYLFSGLFIGPTSQAPRADEARHESTYELGIALQQIPCPAPKTDSSDTGHRTLDTGQHLPWLVDRVFRHLLVDLGGNTHRAEFCIDKLYSPDSGGGRQGLVEFRGFEMPPHARMSLAQQLLLRAMVAWFWEQPYEATLVPWGTQLHDRFMLPYFVAQDFGDVIADLRRAGFALEADWFTPHIEFRFPRLGEVSYQGVCLELRQALEPWHVLGEEPGGGGAVRYVDSSLERVEVRVKGLTDTRHVVACNGRRVPLHPTGVHGQFVAGVRYRAWQPPSCLHPTIGVHTPLVFDVIDAWGGRSIGGCTYHVSHPGGLAFETLPVNAAAAESRRATRFVPFGHTPGSMEAPQEPLNPHYPFTLDLRRR